MASSAEATAQALWLECGGAPGRASALQVTGTGDLPSVFPVTDLAAAAIAVAGLAAAEFIGTSHGGSPAVTVDRRLASFWFGTSVRPLGWSMSLWDELTGDYQAADGWIRLHVNAPHHRAIALAVLDAPPTRDAVTAAVRRWAAQALEDAVVAKGGCAAIMRDATAWAAHPQGQAVMAEPLFHRTPGSQGPTPAWTVPRDRPLHGIRVLDMTRVLAGPVATRFLAGLGAEILRIDPPGWDEPGVALDVTLGKRCARLDLRQPADRAVWDGLLRQADVLVHGYRPDAMDRLGLGPAQLQDLRPGLVEISLDAYGWTGPWRARRGFDSLVQMSCGIAAAGMQRLGRDRPTPLPVQALDHATGYLMAAAALHGLTRRLATGHGSTARTSLARTAAVLTRIPPGNPAKLAPETQTDFAEDIEATSWGPARRLLPPCRVAGAPLRWDWPASALGSAPPAWAG